MSASRLKFCPFCGGTIVYGEINYTNKEFVIRCESNDDCLAEMRLSFADADIGNGEIVSFYEIRKIMDELTEAWNRRAKDEKPR